MPTATMQEEYTAKLKELRDLAAKAEGEDRDFTGEERQEVVRRTEELKALKAKIAEANGDDELRKAIDQLGDDIGVTGDSGKRRDLPPGRPGKGRTVGEQFLDSPTGYRPTSSSARSLNSADNT